MSSPAPLVARPAKDSQKGLEVPAKGVVGQELHGERVPFEPLERSVQDVGGTVPPQILTVADVVTRKSVEWEGEAEKMRHELGAEVGPTTEKMERFDWQDAVELLPVVDLDPEERGCLDARTEEGGLVGSKEVWSPLISSEGSSVGDRAEQCQGGHDKEGEQSVEGGSSEEFVAVSVSIFERRCNQPQLGAVERELRFTEEELGWDGSPR
jgi:hypothetical protein